MSNRKREIMLFANFAAAVILCFVAMNIKDIWLMVAIVISIANTLLLNMEDLRTDDTEDMEDMEDMEDEECKTEEAYEGREDIYEAERA